MLKNEFGKHRTYLCPRCGAFCFRQLHEEPHPCLECQFELIGLRYTIDDVMVGIRTQSFLGVKVG